MLRQTGPVETIYQSSHGNTLSIEFEYPEDNPPDYVRDITTALVYAGVFAGIPKNVCQLEDNPDQG